MFYILSCILSYYSQWKVEMISDPSKYLLLIVGFYQRGVSLFLDVFHCCWYLKDLPIKNNVYCWRFAGGGCYMDYIHSSIKTITIPFLAPGSTAVTSFLLLINISRLAVKSFFLNCFMKKFFSTFIFFSYNSSQILIFDQK